MGGLSGAPGNQTESPRTRKGKRSTSGPRERREDPPLEGTGLWSELIVAREVPKRGAAIGGVLAAKNGCFVLLQISQEEPTKRKRE